MCSNCSKILIGFPVKHATTSCPLLASMHCSVCATFGHPTKCCPKAEAASRSCTIALERAAPVPQEQDPVFSIAGDAKSLRAFLYSQELPTSGKLPALKERVEEWAVMEGYVDVVFT